MASQRNLFDNKKQSKQWHNPNSAPAYTKIDVKHDATGTAFIASYIIDGIMELTAMLSSAVESNNISCEVAADVVKECVFNLTRKVKDMALSAGAYAPQQQTVQQEEKKFLHGSDCKKDGKQLREVSLKVTAVRVAPPGFKNPLIMDFDKQFNCESFPLNKTNIRLLGALCEEAFGSDDLEKLIGNTVIFQIVSDKNPQTNQQVPTLRAASGGIVINRAPTPAAKTKK